MARDGGYKRSPDRRPRNSHLFAASELRRECWSVTALTRRIKDRLEGDFPEVWVEGEISNWHRHTSGHCYFTLKDDQASLACVMWRAEASRLRFAPQDGMKVVAHGYISVYLPRGQYQLVSNHLEPAGLGELMLALEQLKRKLQAEGLFAEARKRPLPRFPRRIGIVSSRRSAGIVDMVRTIHRRWPKVAIRICDVPVQGAEAAGQVAAGIRLMNEYGEVDVLIVGRGGGAVEDLWAFNEEVVARAIVASRVPVISAVGHEVDWTIADLVADRRAATPTAAGELVVPRLDETLTRLAELSAALAGTLLRLVRQARQRLELLSRARALQRPAEGLEGRRQRLDELSFRAGQLVGAWLRLRREHLTGLGARLESLCPLRVLERGYSLTLDARGNVVRYAAQVKAGEQIQTRLARGKIRSRAESIEPESFGEFLPGGAR